MSYVKISIKDTYCSKRWSDSSFFALASWSSLRRTKASRSSSSTCRAALDPSSTAEEEDASEFPSSDLQKQYNKTCDATRKLLILLVVNKVFSNCPKRYDSLNFPHFSERVEVDHHFLQARHVACPYRSSPVTADSARTCLIVRYIFPTVQTEEKASTRKLHADVNYMLRKRGVI